MRVVRPAIGSQKNLATAENRTAIKSPPGSGGSSSSFAFPERSRGLQPSRRRQTGRSRYLAVAIGCGHGSLRRSLVVKCPLGWPSHAGPAGDRASHNQPSTANILLSARRAL